MSAPVRLLLSRMEPLIVLDDVLYVPNGVNVEAAIFDLEPGIH